MILLPIIVAQVHEWFFTLWQTERPESLTVSPSGKFLGIKEKRKLHIWKVPKIDSDSAVSKKITLHHTKTFAVFAFHPTERIVAAGDVTGRILIWRGIGTSKLLNSKSTTNGEYKPGVRDNDDAESCSTWHWHSAGVGLLSFSSDGVYLFSGKLCYYLTNYKSIELGNDCLLGSRHKFHIRLLENFSNWTNHKRTILNIQNILFLALQTPIPQFDVFYNLLFFCVLFS